ncbi:putative transmembrane protein 244 isoform X1 [Hyperolius riggenbachi]|uniref:putative transmembrane protein 244 isoform X1 n=1 Tax=Hyperolius riggenbachi TaxID=752182 RepID=UPI0035A26D0C
MALKIQVAETKVVLQNLFLCTVVFYTVYYLAYTISFLALRLDSFDEFGPFDFKTAPSWASKKYLVNVISLEATFVISSALFVLVVEEWIWDYACTVTMIHIAATSLVMKQIPISTHWWTAIGFGLIAMIVGGQMLAYLLYKDNFIYPDLEHF